MLPSGTLFLDRDDVYQDARARYQAYGLYDAILGQVKDDLAGKARSTKMAFPSKVIDDSRGEDKEQLLAKWHTVAEVAEAYPKLLVWLAGGKVSGLRNVFGLLVAVARLVPGVRLVLWYLMFRKVADRAPWRPALYEAVLQRHLRHENTRALSPSVPPDMFRMTMTSAETGRIRLSSVADVTVPVRTRARDNLRTKAVYMSSGCIGVSGLRGSGKSTLIRDLCQHRYGTPENLPGSERSYLGGNYPGGPETGGAETPVRGLRFVVPAPLRFDPRDFVIYLYTRLCDAVLADPWFNKPSFGGTVLGPFLLASSGRQATALGGLFAAIIAALMAAVLGYYADTQGWPLHSWLANWRDWSPWAGMAVLAAVALVLVLRRTRDAALEARQVIHLAVDAENRLRRLHYQRTYTTSHGGSLSAPMGGGISIGASREFAEQAMTLPELIDDFRDFAERVVAALHEKEAEKEEREKENGRERSHPDVRLIIGIDEMDHIAAEGDACTFLDEISALFGTTNCLFLIAVSPDTLAAVEQRTVPLKTSSSGLFDEMVWVDPLPFHDAASFVNSWVSGMPVPLAALCYALSGGLPRELSRIARAVVAAAGRGGELTLRQATRRVTDEEIVAFTHRTMASAVSLDNGSAFALLTTLTTLLVQLTGWDQPTYDAYPPNQSTLITDVLAEATRLWNHSSPKITPVTREIVQSFIAGLYFLLTVRILFERETGTVDELLMPEAGHPRAYSAAYGESEPDPPALRELVHARGALSVSPHLAVALVNQALLNLESNTEQRTYGASLVMLDLLPGW
jgi:hypothetical protein